MKSSVASQTLAGVAPPRHLVVPASWVVAAAVYATLAACAPEVMRAPGPGDRAPHFSAVTIDGGDSIDSADLLGGPYILNIWATWCAPCRDEMPELQQLHDKYSGQGFQVVGVSVDDESAGPQIREFAAEYGISFPLYHDRTWEIMDAYLLPGLPSSFLIDGDGTVVRKWNGPFHPMEEGVQDDVRALLPESDDG